MVSELYKVAFGLVQGMSIQMASRMLAHIPNEESFFTLPERELVAINGSQHKIFSDNYRKSLLEKASKELDFVKNKGFRLLYYTDRDFPARMLEASDAPILLFGKGECNFNVARVISVVGTRNATVYGKSMTQELVKNIGEAFPDTLIVSGLAYGIDVASHLSAMETGVPTVGVLAHGLHTIYPATHKSISDEMIAKGGALLTEYTSQDEIHRGNFLARNRIIAAMADCVVVVESAEKGGALVTASIAGSYNRDVFAFPGKATDRFSCGCNNLIKNNKAALVTSADDVMDLMRWERKKQQEVVEASLFPEYEPDEQKVIDLLTHRGVCHINEISAEIRIPVYKVSGLLVEMEYKGYVKAVPGGNYTI